MEYWDIGNIFHCCYCLLTFEIFLEEHYWGQEWELLHGFCARQQVGSGFSETEAARTRTATRGKPEKLRPEIKKRKPPGEMTEGCCDPYHVWDPFRSGKISRLTRDWRTPSVHSGKQRARITEFTMSLDTTFVSLSPASRLITRDVHRQMMVTSQRLWYFSWQ